MAEKPLTPTEPGLGDGGVRALKAERDARRHAERQNRELRNALLAAADTARALADQLTAAAEQTTHDRR